MKFNHPLRLSFEQNFSDYFLVDSVELTLGHWNANVFSRGILHLSLSLSFVSFRFVYTHKYENMQCNAVQCSAAQCTRLDLSSPELGRPPKIEYIFVSLTHDSNLNNSSGQHYGSSANVCSQICPPHTYTHYRAHTVFNISLFPAAAAAIPWGLLDNAAQRSATQLNAREFSGGLPTNQAETSNYCLHRTTKGTQSQTLRLPLSLSFS